MMVSIYLIKTNFTLKIKDFGYPVEALWFIGLKHFKLSSNISILSIPDEGYSKNVSYTKFDIYIVIYISYLIINK